MRPPTARRSRPGWRRGGRHARFPPANTTARNGRWPSRCSTNSPKGGYRPPVVAADASHGDTTAFRVALQTRSIGYVVVVKGSTSAYAAEAVPVTAAYAGRGRPSVPRYLQRLSSCKHIIVAAGRTARKELTWRKGSSTRPGNRSAAMRSHFLAVRIRPANQDIDRADDGSLPQQWLIAEWPTGKNEPTDYWISNLPTNTSIPTLIRLAKIRWRIEYDYRELKPVVELDHFEGRSWTGWHHHATLATAAHVFVTWIRLTNPKADGQPGASTPC